MVLFLGEETECALEVVSIDKCIVPVLTMDFEVNNPFPASG